MTKLEEHHKRLQLENDIKFCKLKVQEALKQITYYTRKEIELSNQESELNYEEIEKFCDSENQKPSKNTMVLNLINPTGLSYDTLKEECQKQGMDEESLDKILGELKRQGRVFESRPGILNKI
jgi:DNA replicative helicase MCM subunit Mcm2 (Cdc46/Mcm family)|tara:strand:+ start:641 stop:1009 length:369 start_codon:yes stop_codon:yes gene_type:complete